MPEDQVTIYDLTTRTFTSIPQSELASGMVRGQVVGHEGVVWMEAEQLKISDYRHPPFTGDRKLEVLTLVYAFPGVYEQTYAFWEDGFRRDLNPDREIAVWKHIAAVYGKHAREHALAYRQELFSLVLACSSADAERIGLIFQCTVIPDEDYREITEDYYTSSIQ
jgi:hypothetical protein